MLASVTPTTAREEGRAPVALAPADDAPMLPQGAVVLHVGPHKTGTTSLQFAFHLARPALAAQGVTYAGSRRHSVEAAQAVRGVAPKPSHRHGQRQWRALVDEVRATQGRAVISSEWLSEATPAAIAAIVKDVGADRVHVVVTLRPLASVLPSQWQQYVQGGLTIDYHDWLDAVLRHPERHVTSSFWQRHRHDQLIGRWVAHVGTDRVIAVVADERDPRFVLRSFEGLLGLADGTLALHEDRSNRSLTWPEIEVVRRINLALGEADVDGALRQGLVLFGAAPAIRERIPLPGEARIQTPDWAIDEAIRIGTEMAEVIAASGVRVVGDLTRLARAPERRDAAPESPADAWPDIAAHAVRGVLRRSGVLPESGVSDALARPLTKVSTRRLVGILARRLQRAATRRLARA